MLIGLVVVMTDALLGVTAFFLAPILFHGVVRSKLLLLAQHWKSSIKALANAAAEIKWLQSLLMREHVKEYNQFKKCLGTYLKTLRFYVIAQ
jgi:hypothetical protein